MFKYNCQHCGGWIEFDETRYGEKLPCPHCGNEIELIVAAIEKPPILPVKKRRWFWVLVSFLIFVGLAYAVSLAVLSARFYAQDSKWETSGTIHYNDDIDVTIVSTSIGNVFLSNGEGLGVTPSQNYFLIKVKVSNLNPNKKVDFKTWRSSLLFDSNSSLVDNFGNAYKSIVFEQPILGAQDEAAIYPNSAFTDLLIFEIPVQNTKWLHLKLDASNFGGDGNLKFEIAR